MKFLLRKISFIMTALLLWNFSITAQTTIKGKVVDEKGSPLPGANVYLKGTVLGAMADEDGKFVIQNVPAGSFTLIVHVIGYRVTTEKIQVPQQGTIDVGTIRLESSPIPLEPVVVTASRSEESVQEAVVSVGVIPEQEIRLRNQISLNQALQYVSGLNLNGGQLNIRGATGYTRGVGSRVLLMLDNIPLLTGDTREINYDIIPIYMIERVEVLKGAGSALYGSGAMGGVVHVITRSVESTPTFFSRFYFGLYDQPIYSQWRWSSGSRFFNGQQFGFRKQWQKGGLILAASRDQDDSYRQNDWRIRKSLTLKNE